MQRHDRLLVLWEWNRLQVWRWMDSFCHVREYMSFFCVLGCSAPPSFPYRDLVQFVNDGRGSHRRHLA